MRLATDNAVVPGSKLLLRPSLRAATHLEKHYGGFEKLLSQVSEGNVGALADVLSASANADLLADLAGVPLGDVMPGLIDAASRHVLTLAGVDADNPKPATEVGARTTFADYHAKLFRIGTGWLGWTPQQTWDATPTEILEAYNGHLEMLRAIHGSAEPEQSIPDKPNDATLDRAGLHDLKVMLGAV